MRVNIVKLDGEMDKTIILELNDDPNVGAIGGYCEEGFPIYYVNEKMAQMCGYENIDDFVDGIHGFVSNTIHPDDMTHVLSDLNNGNFYEGMIYKTTYRMVKKDGTWFWTIDQGKVIRAKDGRLAIISICKDMSDFIYAYDELHNQTLLSKSTLENMPGGYHQCSMEEGYPFLYVSNKFLEIFGWTREELYTEFDNKFVNMLHPDDRILTKAYVHRIEKISHTNKVADEIYRLRGKNGYIWVSDATTIVQVGNQSFYHGTLTDISEFVQNKERRETELEQMNTYLEGMESVISAADMGVWHIEMIEDNPPRLLGNKIMLELLGVYGKDMSEEEIYDFWFSNIKEDAVESVLQSVEEMKQGKISENTYLWNHPFLGQRFVRCGGTSQKVEGGYILGGYHYDVDDMIREQNRQQEVLNQTLIAEKQHAQVISSLSTIYTTILLANVNTHAYEVLNSVPLMGMVAGQKGKFDDVKESVLNAFIANDMLDEMRVFLDIDSLKTRLKNINTIVAEYRNPQGRWFQARFIVKSRDTNGDVEEVLYVARDFSKEKNQEFIQQERLNALSIDYTAVFSCDLMKDTMEPLKIKEKSHFYLNKEHTSSFSDWIHFSYENIIDKASIDNYLEIFDKDYLISYLSENKILISRHKVKPNSSGNAYFEVRIVPYYKDEKSFQVVWAFRPIDEIIENEKKTQDQLKQLLNAANQSNKAKTTFLNSMSHDIRTPMNAILGFTALAQTHLDDKEILQDYLSKINTSSTHLLSLINDILDMSRIESGSVKLDEKPVHLPDLLHDLKVMIQGLIQSKNQNLYIDTQDVLHEDVITDKLRLNQVLINIVGNAIKFSPIGGDIIICLREKPSMNKDFITLEFSVKDNGIGISKEFMGHIFDTFTREQSSTVSGIQGTGLGLAITRNIVEDMMHGKIEVESEVGKGSKFTVTIEVKISEEKATYYQPVKELIGSRVLVVDDDIHTCRNVCKMLREIQMRPEWTISGKEAILRAQDAQELQDEYKVYIIDYAMPDMNGIETIRQIRKVIKNDIQIIVLTVYDWTPFEKEARQAGVTAFVSKPIFMSELRNILTNSSSMNRKEKIENQKIDYNGIHALLVEDNELNQEIATALLEEMQMTVDCVNDGIEAVEAIHNADANKYDVIFMDIQMPRMDGYTATREIRTLPDNQKANIPIIALTANAFDDDRKKAIETGMNGHIVKPICMEDIARVLDSLFEKK